MRYGWLLAAPLLSALRLSPASPRSAVLSMAGSTAPQFFGRDPRGSLLSEEKLAQLAEVCKPVTGSSASASDSVTRVLTLEDFEAALAASASRGRLTIFKFYAPWCRTNPNPNPDPDPDPNPNPDPSPSPHPSPNPGPSPSPSPSPSPNQVPDVCVDQEELRGEGGR